MTPAGTSNELDVQNEREENTHTHTSGFLPYILLFTQAPILVWFDSTIIDISTILLTMYDDSGYYVGLCLVAVHGD